MLLTTDLNSQIYPEIQSAIDRDDEGFAQIAIDFAEELAKAYLSRYNIISLFDTRNALLLGILKDIAIHQFCKLAQIQMDMSLIIDNYEKSEKSLLNIQLGKMVPDGWPLKTTPAGADTRFHVSSAPKRDTRY